MNFIEYLKVYQKCMHLFKFETNISYPNLFQVVNLMMTRIFNGQGLLALVVEKLILKIKAVIGTLKIIVSFYG